MLTLIFSHFTEPARHRPAAAVTGIRSTLVGILANAILAGVKAITGIVGNSYALIADAIESAFDIATSLIVLSGIKIASVPADENHPYGHGKAEPLAAMVVSVVLCTAALEYYVDLHVIVNGNKTVTEGHEIAHRVKHALRSSNPKVADVLIHIEPDTVVGVVKNS
jgi:divalent metal cation (Fe/Co/Zn/Cd) transporter